MPESTLLKINANAETKQGFYGLIDCTGTVHEFEIDLTESDATSYKELCFYALLAYLATIHEQGWRGNCITVLSPMGMDPNDLDTVIERFKFNQVIRPPFQSVVMQ